MNLTSRRGFFDSLFEPKVRAVAAGLEEYQPPLTLTDAYHLLRRTTMVMDISFAKSLVGKSAKQAVDLMLNNANAKTQPAPPSWWNETFEDPAGDQAATGRNLNKYYEHNTDLQKWWISLMKQDTNSVLERLTLFWHGHFTSQYTICNTIPGTQMYRQNAIFRRLHLGHFRAFLQEITLDGAMLYYLNGNENLNISPNENYARELMELFSIGIGNYTEEDVREAARVLTGWKVNVFNNGEQVHKAFLRTGLYDKKAKTVFGVEFPAIENVNEENVRQNSINKLIDVILEKRGDAVAKFMANKFYRLYVYSNPNKTDEKIIAELASSFKTSGFNLKALVEKLLKSAHFFDAQNRGIQIKSPAHVILGFTHHFPVEIDKENGLMKELGLELLNPPNVAGWPGYRSWITTKTLPLSIKYITEFLLAQSDLSVADWAQKLGEFDDAYKISENICLALLGRLPNETRLDNYTTVMLGGAPYYEWSNLIQNKENAGFRIKGLIKELIKAPDFYVG